VTAVDTSVDQQHHITPSHHQHQTGNAPIALSSTATSTVQQELQDIMPTSLLSPKSFYSKTVVHAADLSPMPCLSATEKSF